MWKHLGIAATFALIAAWSGAPAAADEAAGMEAEILGHTDSPAPDGRTDSGAVTHDEPLAMTARVEDEKRQTIKGWGCYPASYRVDWSPPELFHIFDMPDVQQALYRDLGMTHMRVDILPKFYNGEADDGSLNTDFIDDTLVRHLRIAQEHGIDQWFVSTWSPPAVMKDPPITSGRVDNDRDKPTRLREDREDDFVAYYVDCLEYLESQGVGRPVNLSIQNELTFPAAWDGCVYEPEQYHRVAKKMRAALDAAGFDDVLIVGPESGSYSGQLQMFGGQGWPLLGEDEELNEAIGGIAFHGYGGEWSNPPWPERLKEAIEYARQLRPDRDVWMTEWSLLDNQPSHLDYAMTVMRRLGRETAFVPVNYWIWWHGWRRDWHGEQLLTKSPGEPITYYPQYHVLRTLWNNATPGSVVRRIETDDPDLQGYDPDTVELVAFDRPERMTVVLVNHTARPRDLTLENLPGSAATRYLTTDERDMEEQGQVPIEGRNARFELPARSITLLITDQGNNE